MKFLVQVLSLSPEGQEAFGIEVFKTYDQYEAYKEFGKWCDVSKRGKCYTVRLVRSTDTGMILYIMAELWMDTRPDRVVSDTPDFGGCFGERKIMGVNEFKKSIGL